jgi:NAD(P)-dependent dehydrogenase (short-subunit alcohol dehydrogenase family)
MKTVIVTGASQGIGAAIASLFLDRGYNVVATSRTVSARKVFAPSARLALIDGDIGDALTAERVTAAALERFGAIDALVNNAGIFIPKPFIEYTADDFKALVSTNLTGFVTLSQLVIRRMLTQKSGGSIVSITSSLADNPIGGLPASLPMITKGGLNAVARSLAIEYAKDGIRVNTVSPGVVDTPLLKDQPQDFLRSLSPLGQIADSKEIAEAVVYLTEARQITGEVLHVDGGAHVGKW